MVIFVLATIIILEKVIHVVEFGKTGVAFAPNQTTTGVVESTFVQNNKQRVPAVVLLQNKISGSSTGKKNSIETECACDMRWAVSAGLVFCASCGFFRTVMFFTIYVDREDKRPKLVMIPKSPDVGCIFDRCTFVTIGRALLVFTCYVQEWLNCRFPQATTGIIMPFILGN
jgi:hypothetical protein